MTTAGEDSQETFSKRWDLDDLPACEVGMILLFSFAKAYPVECAALRPTDLLDFRVVPNLLSEPDGPSCNTLCIGNASLPA
ncbi:hypothetical protein FTO74_04735 [Granulicella sp. WH15]|uniref:hypothetical protein n=1 Tax=Granulicella sp. WH15 TaxID=2602070 RepID=UPI00136772B2|nr:hypothetical protein [Granulicella sp. WH15]QHN02751.1 hypothetical protein FTO74_04735 [Granulicella sp. WH15]